jgi:hypothetical protein
MSKAIRLRSDFKVAVDQIKDRVISNLAEARQQKRFNVNDSEISAILRLIESSFEQGFITSSAQIEKSIDEAITSTRSTK